MKHAAKNRPVNCFSWRKNFMQIYISTCDVHPCYMVPRCPLPRCQSLHFRRSRDVRSRVFSPPCPQDQSPWCCVINLLFFSLHSCTTFLGRSTDENRTPFILTRACANTVLILFSLHYLQSEWPTLNDTTHTTLHTFLHKWQMNESTKLFCPFLLYFTFILFTCHYMMMTMK